MKTLLKRDLEVSYVHVTYNSILKYFNFQFIIEDTFVKCYKSDVVYFIYKNEKNLIRCFKPIENCMLLPYELYVELTNNITSDEIPNGLDALSVKDEFEIKSAISDDLILSIAYHLYEFEDEHIVLQKTNLKEANYDFLFVKDDSTLSIPLYRNDKIVNILDFGIDTLNTRYKAGGLLSLKKENCRMLSVYTNPLDFLKLENDGGAGDSSIIFLSTNCEYNDYLELHNHIVTNKIEKVQVVLNSVRNALKISLDFLRYYANSNSNLVMDYAIIGNNVNLYLSFNKQDIATIEMNKFFNSLSENFRDYYNLKSDIEDEYMVLGNMDYSLTHEKLSKEKLCYSIVFPFKSYFIFNLYKQMKKHLLSDMKVDSSIREF
jgi:hypothetical protein